jgi:hypothetical protein
MKFSTDFKSNRIKFLIMFKNESTVSFIILKKQIWGFQAVILEIEHYLLYGQESFKVNERFLADNEIAFSKLF